jgi:hypothetical protein
MPRSTYSSDEDDLSKESIPTLTDGNAINTDEEFD